MAQAVTPRLSLQTLDLYTRPVYLRPGVDEVELEKDFFQYLCFPLQLSFQQCSMIIQSSTTDGIQPQQLKASLHDPHFEKVITGHDHLQRGALPCRLSRL
jgi:hypothetical protein